MQTVHLGDPSSGLQSAIAPGQPRAVGQRSTTEVACPRSMVGRVIGKNGETIKALQLYTNALIQIDQSTDPTRVTISGTPQSLHLAVSMVTDICKGTFKGFALLRQLIQPQRPPPGQQQPFNLGPLMSQQRPVYAPGYGLIPPSQLYGADATAAGGLATGPTTIIDPTTGVTQVIGGRPMALQLPPGYQYATLQPGGGMVATDPSQQQVLVQGLGGAHHMTAGGQLVDGSGAGGSGLLGAMQALPMQQVYSMPSHATGAYGSQAVSYASYPQEAFFSATGPGGEPLQLYPQQDGTLVSLQPSQQALGGMQAHDGGSSKQMIGGSGAARGGQGMGQGMGASSRPSPNQVSAGMQPRWSSGGGWVDMSKVGEGQTMGHAAMNQLLGGRDGGHAGGGGMGGQPGSHGSVQQQQLVQVIGPEGKVSYYLQGNPEHQS